MWSVLTGSNSFWEGPVLQQLLGSKKSSLWRKEMIMRWKNVWKQEIRQIQSQKFEIFRESDLEQIVIVLTEIVLTKIVLTEIEKSNTVSWIVVVSWTSWDRLFSAWTCENEIFSWWSRWRDKESRSSAIQDFISTWTCWDEIFSKWSRICYAPVPSTGTSHLVIAPSLSDQASLVDSLS
jgi:hypothetical protein